MNVSAHRLRFGASEWLGVAALCLTPAIGFGTWAVHVNSRLEVMETRVATIISREASAVSDHDLLIRVDQRTAACEMLLKDLAARMDRATATAKAGQ